jgi:hypothetical protein
MLEIIYVEMIDPFFEGFGQVPAFMEDLACETFAL